MDSETALEGTAPLDYRLVCRTCLVSDAEFYKLDSPIFVENHDSDEKPVSFMDCLRYCTRFSDYDECGKLQYPIYICTECSAALQVSYNFIKNALEAHEILRQKLGEYPEIQQKNRKILRKNGLVEETGRGSAATQDGVEADVPKMRFRCKICNEKVETKRALKEHIKLHLDIISYCCQLCNFECKKRTLLFDHYKLAHHSQPTKEQLKPKTMQPNQAPIKREEEIDFEDSIAKEMEKIHNNHVNVEYLHDTQNEIQDQQQPQDIDMKLFLTPASSNASAAAAYVEAATAATAVDDSTETNTVKTEPGASISTHLQQYGTEEFNVAANELSVGNEFIVMADGTVEEVMGNGVVIEYINAADDGVTLENGLVMDNIMQVQQTGDMDQTVTVDMDVDDMIIEECIGNDITGHNMSSITMAPETTVQTLQNIEDELPPPAIISTANLLTAKRIKCKICASNFQTQDQLKTHMLTHNEIPHFFCDQCAFYTFFKIDLTQHYKTKHKLQPTQKQLQPKNKVKPHEQPGDMKHVYACDLCLFETRIKAHLRRHYLSQHQEEATEVQLRPTIDESVALTQPEDTPSDSPPKQRGKVLRPDYPKGLNCKKCSKVFYWRDKLKEHYRQHGLDESNGIDVAANDAMMSDIVVNSSAPGTSLLKQNTFQYQLPPSHGGNNVNIMLNSNIGHNHYDSNATANPGVIDAQAIVDAAVAEAQAAGIQINMQMNAPAPDIIMDIPVATTITNTAVAIDTTVGTNHVHGIQQQHQQQQQHHHQPVAVMAGYACQQIPSDAIPQVVETETTIDNSELNFVFNDALFEDFDEDENEDEENEEDGGSDFQDLLLTSDDDFNDMLEDEQQKQRELAGELSETPNASNYQPYCVHCNRKFFSQYHFENHMFVHRGLAPYRCEMCTNLYNTKRALIRHYRAVHKKIPTRDMIQAKGDKAIVDHTPIEHLNLIEQKAVTLMCAKCPFESVDLTVMQIHLNTMHGLVDENFILQKLPFECPRCIRSCATRARLIRHLERSHSVATIIQQHRTTNNVMRNQLQQQQQQHQQQQQQQQQMQNQPFIAIKDTATATTTTTAAIAAATAHLSASTIAVTTFSPAATTSSSCGRGKNMQSYQFNNNNNHADDDDDDEGNDDGDGEDDDNVDAVDNAVGVNVVGGDGVCIEVVNINNNNNNHNRNNTLDNQIHYTVETGVEISSLSKLIADMEHDEDSQVDDAMVTTTMFSHTNANALLRKQGQGQCSKESPTTAAANMPQTSRKNMSNVVNSLITANMYNQLNENNELFDEYACGMCSQSWRTAAELHAHECIRLAGTVGNDNKETVEHATTTSTEDKHTNRKSVENVGLITSERSLYLFKCDICHCNYKSSELLKHHKKRHTARIFRCNHCPKTYINRSELKFHQLSHTGEKPHKCEMCPKQFRYPHHLKRHCDVAHLGKRARCPVGGCGRTFTTQAQLKIHAWIHDGNEPYRCKYCRQSFKKRESLRKHTRRVHHFDLTEEEIADIYRQNVGHTNPHDFTVSLSNGRMLRRSDLEQVDQHAMAEDLAAVSASASETANVGIDVKTDMDTNSSLSPLLASNSHKNINIQQLVLGVEEEDETAVSHISQTSNSLSTHEETIHTYMLPGMEEHGQLPHFKLENSGSF